MFALQSFTFNAFFENTYIVYEEDSRHAVIVDAGCYATYERQEITSFIQSEKLLVQALINTHAHLDHMLGVTFLQKKYDIPFYLHKDEMENFSSLSTSAPLFGIEDFEPCSAFTPIEENKSFTLGSGTLDVYLVPGHAPGHVVFYSKKDHFLVAGDTLFRESIGRTDLPGGDHETLLRKIQEVLFTLPDHTKVYPGHGDSTTIAHEKLHNPFLQKLS